MQIAFDGKQRPRHIESHIIKLFDLIFSRIQIDRFENQDTWQRDYSEFSIVRYAFGPLIEDLQKYAVLRLLH